MKEIASEFVCNLKQDALHALGDQSVYWSIRLGATLTSFTPGFQQWESFLFYHGWLILLVWRVLNAAIDTYKRVRDVGKPEWKTQVKPLLVAEERRRRKAGFRSNIWKTIKQMMK